MSAPLVVGNFVLLRVWTRTVMSGGQASVNNLWYVVAAVGSPGATDEDAAVTLDALVFAQYQGMMTQLAEYRGVQAQIYDGVTPPYRALYSPAFTNANAGFGTAGATPLPTQTCGLISFETPKPRQANRGRFYMPFPDAANESGGGSPDSIYVAQLVAMAGFVGVGLAVSRGGRTATLARVLKHGKDKLGNYPSPVFDAVTGATSQNVWATQRRRGAFGRQNKSPI